MGSLITSWLAFDISLLVAFVPFVLWLLVTYRRYHIVAEKYTVFRWTWVPLLFWFVVHLILLFAVFLWYRDEQPASEYDTLLGIVHADIVARALVPFVLEWGAPRVDKATGMVAEPSETTRNAMWWTMGILLVIVVFGWVNFGLAAAAKAATITWVLWLIYAALVSVALGFAIYIAATYPIEKNEMPTLQQPSESAGSIQMLAQRRARRG